MALPPTTPHAARALVSLYCKPRCLHFSDLGVPPEIVYLCNYLITPVPEPLPALAFEVREGRTMSVLLPVDPDPSQSQARSWGSGEHISAGVGCGHAEGSGRLAVGKMTSGWGQRKRGLDSVCDRSVAPVHQARCSWHGIRVVYYDGKSTWAG